MRSDMSKVVTERPRSGHANHNPNNKMIRRLQTTEVDEDGGVDTAASHRGKVQMRPKGTMDRKEFSDHIMPLRRALQSAVGRPWDDVYSEIVKCVPKGTLGEHIREHIRWEVERDIRMEDGAPMVLWGKRGWRPLLTEGRRTNLFVNPDTGILSAAPRPPKKDTSVHNDLIFVPAKMHPNKWELYIAKELNGTKQWFRLTRTSSFANNIYTLLASFSAPATNALMAHVEMKGSWYFRYTLTPCKSPRI